jgi:CheY-like chemotaxis protein
VIAGRPKEEPRFHGRTILVVDDHPDSRDVLAQLLAQEGALVMTAHDGRAALQMLETQTPDLILTDLRMPGLDGLALARRLKADARWTHVPLVATTALGTTADLRATFEAGFAAHVVKPLDWQTLIATIERVLPAARVPPTRPRRRRRRP